MPRFLSGLHGVTIVGVVSGRARQYQAGQNKETFVAVNLACEGDEAAFPVRVQATANVLRENGAALGLSEVAEGAQVAVTGRLSTYENEWRIQARSVQVIAEGAGPRAEAVPSANGVGKHELVPAK